MPQYDIAVPGRGTFRVDSPTPLTDDQAWQAVQDQLNAPAPKSAGFSLKDTGRAAQQGLYGGLQALTDLFGAGNVVSKDLTELQQEAASKLSEERKAEIARRELLKKKAEGNTWEEIKATVGGFTEAPFQTSVGALTSSAPIIASAFLPGGQPAAVAGLTGRAALGARALAAAKSPAAGIGALMGVGGQKGQDYQAVKEALLAKQFSEADAERLAQEVSGYSLENAPRQVAAGLVGGLEGVTGIEGLLGRAGRLGKALPKVDKAVDLPEPTYGQALRRNILGEAAPEALQAATGQVGTNIALTQAGIPTDLSQGVLAQVIHDALVGGTLGAATSPLKMREMRQEFVNDEIARKQEEDAKIAEGIKKAAAQRAATKQQLVGDQPLLLAGPSQELEPVKEVAPLQNPIGNLTPDELGPEVTSYLNQYRKSNGLPRLNTYSIEDVKDAMTAINPEGEKAALDSILAAKTGYTGQQNFTAKDVENAAIEKNVATGTQGFSDFLARTTGVGSLDQMSEPQLYAAFKALSDMPANTTGQQIVLPEGTNASRFTQKQYDSAVKYVGLTFQENNGKPLSTDTIVADIKDSTNLATDRDAKALLDTAIKNGDLEQSQQVVYRTFKPDTDQLVATYPTRERADAAAKKQGLNVREATLTQVAPKAPVTPPAAPRAGLPAGYDITERQFKEGEEPEGYQITSEEGGKPFPTILNQSEVEGKIAQLSTDRREIADNKLQEVLKYEQTVNEGKRELEKLEAAGEFDTDNYKQKKARQAAKEDLLGKRIEALYKEIQSLTAPLKAKPFGVKPIARKGFTVTKEGKESGTFPTREAAEESILTGLSDAELDALVSEKKFGGLQNRAAAEQNRRRSAPATTGKKVSEVLKDLESGPPVEETAELLAMTKPLRDMLNRFGLGDVALKIVKAIENKADGSYAGKLIELALDAKFPIRTLRHESLHALKELGFFTDAQWASLEKMAKSQWIDKYLKKGSKALLSDGSVGSRYDAYIDINQTAPAQWNKENPDQPPRKVMSDAEMQELLIEEAIADAFADFDINKAPPGMLTALLNKMRGFFDSLNNYLAGRGFENSRDIFSAIEKGKLKPKAPAAQTQAAPKAKAPAKQTFVPKLYDNVQPYEETSPPPGSEYAAFSFFNVDGVHFGVVSNGDVEVRVPPELQKYTNGERNIVFRNGDNRGGVYSSDNLPRQLMITPLHDALVQHIESRGDVDGVRNAVESLRQSLESGGKKKLSVQAAEEGEPVKTVDPKDVRNIVKNSPYKDAGINVLSSQIEETSKPLKVDEVGKLFDDAYMAEFGKQGDWRNPADFKRAVVQSVDEVKFQMQQAKSGQDWYDEDVALAFADTQTIIPSLADPQKRAFFSVLAGIMSPSTNARENWVIAAEAYQHYEKTGTVPGRNPANGNLWMGGLTSATKEKQLNMLNKMMQPVAQGGLGEKATIEWMQSSHTVKEINDMRRKYGNMGGIDGKAGDLKLGFTAFGPKVGPFVMNINGIHEVTVDVWMTRTFNRYFGQMMGPDGKMIEAPTEPQRVAVKNLAVNVAQQLNLKPYQVQSMLWFYEQQLFNKLGTGAKSYGFSDGAKKFVETQSARGGKVPPSTGGGNAPANRTAGQRAGQASTTAGKQPAGKPKKLSLGVVAEVAPNPDFPPAAQWRQMSPAERLNATTAVARKVMNGLFDELGLKGYTFKFSTGTYEGEVNPNIIVNAPQDASVEEVSELARVMGYALDQKAMVVFDDENTQSGSQAGFVVVKVPENMSEEAFSAFREHVGRSVPQVEGDTLRDGKLFFGNFSEYNDKIDTVTDAEYHKAIVSAVESFDYDGAIEVYPPRRFHSELIWPDNRQAYLTGTRYGASDTQAVPAGGTALRGIGSGRLQAISDEAIALRDRWIDARGAARYGSRSQLDAASYDDPTAEYGVATPDSTSAIGVHFSKQPRATISSAFYGSGLRGLEAERLNDSANSDIKSRAYFYVDTGQGIRPEAGVGGTPHVIQLNNLYDVQKDPLQIVKGVRGTTAEERANRLERGIMNAGFDGYVTRDPIMNQGFAVLIGKHNIKTDKKLSLREAPDTPEFKRFFGRSGFINSSGQPMTMYHATDADITEFRTSEDGKLGAGIYLSSVPKYVTQYAPEGSVMPLYASAQNPFILNIRSASVKSTLESKLPFVNGINQQMEAAVSLLTQGKKRLKDLTGQQVQNLFKRNGYDGILARDDEGNIIEATVFKPEQVKSATGNVGTYSPKSKDIRYSLRDATDMFAGKELEKASKTEYKGRYKLVNMDIDDFLKLSKVAGQDAGAQSRADARVQAGTPFTSVPHLYVDPDGTDLRVTGHDGRHRARALKNAGYDTMPVELRSMIRWSEQTDPESSDYRENWPERIYAEEGALREGASVPMPVTREQSPLNYQSPAKKFSVRSVEDTIKAMPNGDKIHQAVAGKTTVREEKSIARRILDAFSGESISSLRQQALNRYNQLSVYDKMLADKMGGKALLADSSAEAAALLSDTAAGVAAAAFGVNNIGGAPVYRNGVTVVDNFDGEVKGLMDILMPLAELKDPFAYRAFQFYAASKRGSRFEADGREQLFDQDDFAYAAQLEAEYPMFKQVHADWIAYNDKLVDYMVATGIISKGKAKKFTKYADYIPFYRQLEGQDTIGPKVFQSISGVKAPKKLKGESDAPLADFMETIVRNTQSIIQAGMKNTAGQKAVDVALQLDTAEKLDKQSSAPGTVTIMRDGEYVSYAVSDELFINSIKSLNMPDVKLWGIFAGPAGLLRSMVTKDPGFMLANLLRDSMSAYVTSGVKMTPVADTVANFGRALGGTDPTYQALVKAGILGGYDYAQGVERSGAMLAADLRKRTGGQTLSEKALDGFGLWSTLEKGTSASDAATRMAVYNRVLEDTGNEAEAIFRALEVMNFNRKGSNPMVRLLTAAIPFLNARMQGLDVFYRAGIQPFFDKSPTDRAKAVQKAFFVRGMYMTSLSVAYWAMTHDDDDYLAQEQETRDNNWLIPSLGVKIPIPFEVGVLFKVIPERILGYTLGDDTGKDFAESMGRAAWSTFGFLPVPQTALPLLEAATNYSFYTGRNIVGSGMEGVADKFQQGPSTSKVASFLGGQLGVSPMKVDHMIKGYTGTIGTYMVDLMDSIGDLNSESPKAAKRFEQMPVLKRFAVDPEAKGTVTAYYKLKDAVDETVRTINLLERTGKYEELSAYVQENAKLFGSRQYISSMEKQMKVMREAALQINNSSMSAVEKRDSLSAINQAQINMTRHIQSVKKVLSE